MDPVREVPAGAPGRGAGERSPVPGSAVPPSGTLAVLIPCLDEERTVARVVRGVPGSIPPFTRIEILVIDDGSTDGTAAEARAAGARVVSLGRHRGLGQVFRAAVESAIALGADAAVTIDGDGQFDPADIPRLLEPLRDTGPHMVTASRFADPALTPRMPWIKRWGNRRIARIVRWLTGRRFHDVSCGFRAFTREALLRMNLFGGFTYTQETFIDLVFKGLEIREVPIAVRGVREYGRSRIAASIPRYALHSMAIMLRTFLGYRPFAVFASLSALFFAASSGLLGFLLAHYLQTGAFSPHIWAGFVGGSLGFVGVVVFVLGLIGDMLVRIRMNQEEILYRLKRAGSTDTASPEA